MTIQRPNPSPEIDYLTALTSAGNQMGFSSEIMTELLDACWSEIHSGPAMRCWAEKYGILPTPCPICRGTGHNHIVNTETGAIVLEVPRPVCQDKSGSSAAAPAANE